MSDTRYNLEKAAAEVASYLSQGPALYELPLADVRNAVDGAQEGAPMPDIEEASVTVPTEVGEVRVSIMRPRAATGQLPTVLYMHGGGWILGSVHSHGRLAGELAVASDAAVVFIEYALAPEASAVDVTVPDEAQIRTTRCDRRSRVRRCVDAGAVDVQLVRTEGEADADGDHFGAENVRVERI